MAMMCVLYVGTVRTWLWIYSKYCTSTDGISRVIKESSSVQHIYCDHLFHFVFLQILRHNIEHYRETWPGSSLSSRRAPRQTCHGRGANLRPPAKQAATLPKKLSRQLIRWLFGTSARCIRSSTVSCRSTSDVRIQSWTKKRKDKTWI